MDICVKALSFDEYCGLKEPNRNNLASTYMSENMNSLIKYINKLKVTSPEDLFQDVFLSILKSEEKGEGYNQEYGDGTITVAQFVYGRIERYAKNKKFSDNKCEVAASTSSEEVEDMDSFQKAFAMASVSDTTDDVDEYLSIRDELEYCVSICDFYNINIRHIVRNMQEIVGAGAKALKVAVANISDIVGKDRDFGEVLWSVLNFGSKYQGKLVEMLDELGVDDNGTRVLASC